MKNVATVSWGQDSELSWNGYIKSIYKATVHSWLGRAGIGHQKKNESSTKKPFVHAFRVTQKYVILYLKYVYTLEIIFT